MKSFFNSAVIVAAALIACASCTRDAGGNSVMVKTDAQRVRYNPMIFGHFIEHFHRQVYDGIYQPGSPLSDEDGFRTDVIEAMKEIKVPIVRWPGGCFVSSYHWTGGVGPERTPVYDKSWAVEDPNTFGTDEYVKWCRKVGCEPYICTNAGTGTAEEMSDWVEYCNLTVGKWGRLRARYGHPEPYDVKYWSIGNENYGGWELGAKTVDEWGHLVCESAKLMRAVTKDAVLFAAANDDPLWSIPLLQKAGGMLDYISIHGYWDFMVNVNVPSSFTQCMMKTDDPEAQILRTIKLLEDAGFGDGRIKIAFDEWNLKNWHHPGHGNLRKGFDIEARDGNDDNSLYTMSDALFSACFLNSCLRHSDVVDIACFSPIVNTRGALYVHDKGIVKRTTYHVFKMYTSLLEEFMVPLEVHAEKLESEGRSTGVIDAVLTVSEDAGRHAYALVNKDPLKAREVSLDFCGKEVGGQVAATVLSGSGVDDYNDVGREDSVVPYETTLEVALGKVSVPPHSLCIVRF